jgi:hypothetical protein
MGLFIRLMTRSVSMKNRPGVVLAICVGQKIITQHKNVDKSYSKEKSIR